MKTRRFTYFAAATLAGALMLTGCSSSGSASSEAKYVSVNGSEPENPLLPGVTNETGGGKILALINSGLVYYDAKGESHNELAESIKTDDAQNYTITLKKGMKFSDGTEVKAKNFVDAWQYIVKNSQRQSFFFESIDGFKEGAEMSGLSADGDYVIKVKLAQPEADWPLRLGYSAFSPMPDKFFADPKAYGENPLSSGPYKLSEWNHNQDVTLVPNESYVGDRKAQNDGVKIRFIAQLDAAYNELLSDNLDILDAIPDSAFGDYQKTLGDRAVNKPAAIFQSFTINSDDPHFSGEEGHLRRQAISMAINRKEVTDTIFKGTRTPARDYTSPVIAGWKGDLPGSEVLNFNPTKAKELWAKADAISKYDGTFKIAYNSDGGHQAWVDAVTNSIKNNLGIKAEGASYPDFKSLRTEVSKHQIKTAYRTGWQADYPSLYNFLGPLYATGAPSNDGQYSNPKFDALLKEGLGQKTPQEANAKFDEAQQILFKDLPSIPLWYSNVNGGYAKTVSNVEFGWDSAPLLYKVTKK
ncbi:ABC transporter substrate-binding protein [Actinomycetaceae bacterium TAE3-ERU4]|nr:ABC transporter substrate-binding protein [Actinomycetaceae bacterium TAE3-ERU4]